jgi:hypothetical protein
MCLDCSFNHSDYNPMFEPCRIEVDEYFKEQERKKKEQEEIALECAHQQQIEEEMFG